MLAIRVVFGESTNISISLEDLKTNGSELVERLFKSVSVNLVFGLLTQATTSITELAPLTIVTLQEEG